MVIINEDKWDDIKRDFLGEVKYEFHEEPLIYFNHKTNNQEEIGTREIYEFSKKDMDFMLILDKEHRLIKTTSEKDGKFKEHFQRSPDEFTFKLSIKYRHFNGDWKDSSAMEGNL
jgi:hypothetical protein